MNIDKLKQVIQQANPEIMELKFGCEVNLDGGESYGLGMVVQRCTVCPKHKKWETCENNDFECGDLHEEAVVVITGDDEAYWERIVKLSDIKPYQILGRAIRLADVLVAVKRDDMSYHVSISDTRKMIDVLALWSLLDDNLDHQSDECKQFLYDLLVKE